MDSKPDRMYQTGNIYTCLAINHIYCKCHLKHITLYGTFLFMQGTNLLNNYVYLGFQLIYYLV